MQPRQSDVLQRFVDATWFTETDRERGVVVHKACNARLRNLFIPALGTRQGYFNSFSDWADSMIKETLYAEGWAYKEGVWVWHGPLISRLGFTGTPDFIGLLTGEKDLAIVDWKTSISIQKVWQLQVSGAYRIAAEDNGYKPIGRCLSLRLDKDGGQAKVKEYGSMMDVAFFCKHLDVWRFWNEA